MTKYNMNFEERSYQEHVNRELKECMICKRGFEGAFAICKECKPEKAQRVYSKLTQQILRECKGRKSL